MDGTRAYFSNTGSYLSLGGAGLQRLRGRVGGRPWPRAQLPWSSPGYYGWASGTSFSSPEVAGAAALVWAANPRLTAQQVAKVLKQSATGTAWNRELGWGRLDAAAAVQLALETRRGATAGRRPRAAADPLLAALVDLLLPERHGLLERVDRVLARGERVLRGAGRRRRSRRSPRRSRRADAVVDRDRAELVALLRSAASCAITSSAISA